jgi:hypothetical protein
MFMFFFLFKRFFFSGLLAVLFWQVDLAVVCLPICSACQTLAYAGGAMGGKVSGYSRVHGGVAAGPGGIPSHGGAHQGGPRHASKAGRGSISHMGKAGHAGAGSSIRHISKPSHGIRGIGSHRGYPVSRINSYVDHHRQDADQHYTDHHSGIDHNITSEESGLSEGTDPVHSEFPTGTTGYESSVVLAVNPDQLTLDTARAQGMRERSSVTFSHLGMTVTAFEVPGGEDAANVLARFHSKGVSRVMLNQYYRLDEGPQKEHVQYGYPGPLIKWPVPSLSCGYGIKIGMVDSYVDTGNPLLAGQRISRKAFARQAKKVHVDHGTTIAELLVGGCSRRFCGLLPNAILFAAAAFSDKNSDAPRATALAIIKSLDWLVSKKVQVINLSFSGPDNGMLAMAMNKILAKRIPVVAAAGNYGSDGPPAYPAAYPGVIAVTAVDKFRRPFADANRGKYITFAAPGVRVPVPCGNGDICYKSGTSYAAPYCTALIAGMLRPRGKKKTVKALVVRLQHDAVDLGAPGKDSVFGWGLVRCGKGCRGRR